jgi:hypothetical protein
MTRNQCLVNAFLHGHKNQGIWLSVVVRHLAFLLSLLKLDIYTLLLLLQAYFLDGTSSVTVHSMFTSPSKTYIQLKTRDEYIKVMLVTCLRIAA